MFDLQFFLILSNLVYLTTAQSSCEVNVTLLPENEPVYFEKNSDGTTFRFFNPRSQVTTIPFNGELTLLCPGSYFVDEGMPQKTLRCKGGKIFTDIDLKLDVDIHYLACAQNKGGDYEITNEVCGTGGRGRLYLLGYKLNGYFVRLIEVCFNDLKASAFFSRHTINGAAMRFSIKMSDRKSFSSAGIYCKPYELYTQAKQSEVLLSLYNMVPQSDMYYLSRGHLSPDADFIFTSWQFATYYYLNAMPEHQIINQGNWLRVERLARNVAIASQTNINIVTGGQEILYFRHTTTNLEYPFHLNPVGEFIEVPEFIYKVLMNDRDRTGIVLITSNNPYLKKAPVDMCPNVCVDSGLTYPGPLQDFDKGYTICCSIPAFKRVAKDIPNNLPDYNLMNLRGIVY